MNSEMTRTGEGMFQDYETELREYLSHYNTQTKRIPRDVPGTVIKLWQLCEGKEGVELVERPVDDLLPFRREDKVYEFPPSRGVIAVRDLYAPTFVGRKFIEELQSRHPRLDLTLIAAQDSSGVLPQISFLRPLTILSGEEVLPETREYLEQRELIWAPGAFPLHIYDREEGSLSDGGPFSSCLTAIGLAYFRDPETKKRFISEQIGNAVIPDVPPVSAPESLNKPFSGSFLPKEEKFRFCLE
jgi:hypothetical protein